MRRARAAIDLRPVAAALAAGVVIGFAQAAPMLHLPLYFALVDGVSPLVSSVAIAPFVVALVVAGPVSGWLLARFSPRALIAGGFLAVAAADLVAAAVIGGTTPYPAFIVSFVPIGAGFVVATTVRTAVIFASVPRALPASAAALNEASLGLGARLAITVATVVMARTAIAAYGGNFTGLPADAVESLVAPFREVVTVIGLPAVHQPVADLSDATRASYLAALIAGWRMSELVPGVVALVGAGIVFFALGARDPVRSVWDLADEREEA